MVKFNIKKITESRELKNRVAWITALLVILFVLFISNPDKISLTKCLFHETTGYSCPSCGLSRSLYAASHFNLYESIHFHLMGPIIYFAVLVLFFKFSFEMITQKEIQIKVRPKIIKIAIASFLGLWVIFMMVRFISEIYNH